MMNSFNCTSVGRIINICSHCSLEALPGLSVYAGSKAGLLAWTNALRVELKKFGVPVISLIPGTYINYNYSFENFSKHCFHLYFQARIHKTLRFSLNTRITSKKCKKICPQKTGVSSKSTSKSTITT